MSADSSRISVSLDVLRNELTQLELRIVDRIAASLDLKADKAVVAEHDKRLTTLELSRAAREHMANDVAELQRRITVVETAEAGTKGVAEYKRWLLPLISTLIGGLWWLPVLLHHG